MNEWMNECKNEWDYERMHKRINEYMKRWKENKCKDEWMNE